MKIYKIAKTDDQLDLVKLQESYFKGWEAKVRHMQGESIIINPQVRDSAIGRAFLCGWNDKALGKPKQIPSDLMEKAQSDSWMAIK
jgi:hypothetical protein